MRILCISDIDWLEHKHLEQIVHLEQPDVVSLAGDVSDDGYSRATSQLLQFLLFLEHRRIKTFVVRGNHDLCAYDEILKSQHFRFVEELSAKYAHHKEVTFLGIPSVFFDSMRDVRQIRERFPKPVDIIITHPSTMRRIWVFELKPKIVLMGHDDLRVCKVLHSLLITTNKSPMNYAVIELTRNRARVSYRQYHHANRIEWYSPFPNSISSLHGQGLPSGYLKYEAIWCMKSNTMKWSTKQHYCFNPPYAYPAKDAEYGKMLAALLIAKEAQRDPESVHGLTRSALSRTPKKLLNEFLGIPRR